jgi:hypothetical protein
MSLKCCYHLHPLAKSKRGLVDQGVGKDNSWDIFERIANTSEPPLELMTRELLIFNDYQVDVKDIKCPLP